MRMFLAAINSGIMLIGDDYRHCRSENGSAEDVMNIISTEITEKVIHDDRFILAVGEEKAATAQFRVERYAERIDDSDLDEVDGLEDIKLFNRIELYAGNQKTDFAIDYEVVLYGDSISGIESTYVVYQHDGMTYMAHPFKFYRMGATDAETLTWDYESDILPRIWLERIVFEILNDRDILVFADVAEFYGQQLE